jgi:hypothetical protein
MTAPEGEERWTIVQVASHLSISYQTARNNMLAGDYGMSEYDAETRKLTVLAGKVRSVKKATRKREKRRRANNQSRGGK